MMEAMILHNLVMVMGSRNHSVVIDGYVLSAVIVCEINSVSYVRRCVVG